jgi:hypothetical protein
MDCKSAPAGEGWGKVGKGVYTGGLKTYIKQ